MRVRLLQQQPVTAAVIYIVVMQAVRKRLKSSYRVVFRRQACLILREEPWFWLPDVTPPDARLPGPCSPIRQAQSISGIFDHVLSATDGLCIK